MMKTIFGLMVAVFLLPNLSLAQGEPGTTKIYRNFPIIITLHFQNLAMPFRDVKSNFKHIGISIGTEVSHNGKHNWVQQFHTGFYLNKEAGNGLFAYTQTLYRPIVVNNFFGELKAGFGWQRIFYPVEAYKFRNENWVVTKGGKSQWIVPIGFSLGHHNYKPTIYVSPILSYQIVPALSYNKSIPLHFYSFFQVATNIHPQY